MIVNNKTIGYHLDIYYILFCITLEATKLCVTNFATYADSSESYRKAILCYKYCNISMYY
jgi:hypothetical protein